MKLPSIFKKPKGEIGNVENNREVENIKEEATALFYAKFARGIAEKVSKERKIKNISSLTRNPTEEFMLSWGVLQNVLKRIYEESKQGRDSYFFWESSIGLYDFRQELPLLRACLIKLGYRVTADGQGRCRVYWGNLDIQHGIIDRWSIYPVITKSNLLVGVKNEN